jgi:hypothetical protein
MAKLPGYHHNDRININCQLCQIHCETEYQKLRIDIQRLSVGNDKSFEGKVIGGTKLLLLSLKTYVDYVIMSKHIGFDYVG